MNFNNNRIISPYFSSLYLRMISLIRVSSASTIYKETLFFSNVLRSYFFLLFNYRFFFLTMELTNHKIIQEVHSGQCFIPTVQIAVHTNFALIKSLNGLLANYTAKLLFLYPPANIFSPLFFQGYSRFYDICGLINWLI